MAVGRIETQAVITAKDATGQTFGQIAQKLRGLEATAAGVSRRMDSVARGMSAVGQARERYADIARRMSSVNTVTSSGFFALSAAQRERALATAAQVGASVATTAVVAAPIIRQALRHSAARIHENLRMATSGMTSAEIADAQAQMSKLSREFKQTPSTDIGAMLRNARTVVGAYSEAVSIAEPMLKLGTALRFTNKHLSDEDVTREMESLIRAADLAGATKNVAAFKNYISGVGRAMLVFGDSVKPIAFFEAAQHAGGAVTQYSPGFVSTVLPSLIQTMGGPGAGTSLGTFFSALIGGKMRNKSAKILGELGLLDSSKVLWNKTGDVKGLMPGAIKGTALALTNPYEWTLQYVLPGLLKKGITDPGQITNYLAAAFSDRRAGALVTHMILNRAQIDRDIQLGKGGMDLDSAVRKISREDPAQVWGGLVNSAGELGRVLGKDVTPLVTQFGVRMSDVVGETSSFLDKSAAARNHALAGGAGAALLGGHLSLGLLGGYLGGPGLAAALGAAFPVVAAAGTVGLISYALARQRERYLEGNSYSAAAARMRRMPSDPSFAGVRNRLIVNSLGLAQEDRDNWRAGFGFGGGVGEAPFEYQGGRLVKRGGKSSLVGGRLVGQVAPGLLAFGPDGINPSGGGALRLAPSNPAAERRATEAAKMAELLAALKERTKVEVEVKPVEPLRVEITASGELVRLAGDARQATRESRLSATANASGPGSTGSTDFGTQR